MAGRAVAVSTAGPVDTTGRYGGVAAPYRAAARTSSARTRSRSEAGAEHLVDAAARHLALAAFAATLGQIGDVQTLAPQQGGADALEMRQFEATLADTRHQHAATDFLGRIGRAAEQRVQTRHQRLDVRRQDAAGVEVGEQMLHGQQRMDLRRREPQAGQFIGFADPPAILGEAVTAGQAVVDDGRIEPVAHIDEIAPQGGARDLQRRLQRAEGHRRPLAEQLVDAAEPFGLVHPTAVRRA